MAKAITYNNAGVVEAIKRNSGSTKFYKASYQGIIEAIEDWGGGNDSGSGGGTTVLPPGSSLPNTGNTAGDLVVVPNGDGDYFMYVFANGSWERLHITTEEVETAGSAPFALVTDDGVTIKNQKDINAYLDERITALSEKGYDDTGIKADLAKEVTDRTEGDQALQDQIDALEGYDDATIKAELAQEITDRTEGDQALQDQIDALEGYDDTTLSERIDQIEEGIETALGVQEQIIDRVQELPTWVTEVPPVDKQEGDLWFDSGETGQLYVRYGGEWVVACPPVTDEDLAGTVSDVEALANTALQKANLVEYSLYQQGELLKWDQERQDSQIYELEEEIESIAPSFDRGKWQLISDELIGPGQYAMAIGVDSQYCQEKYLKCLAEADGDDVANTACLREMGECEAAATEDGGELYMNDWAHAAFLHFHKLDSDGKEHTFGDYGIGKYIDLFDQEDDDYALFEITEAPTKDGDIYTIGVTPIQHNGEAGGLARIKVFEIAAADPTAYVRKTGDTMSGDLEIKADAYSDNSDDYPALKFVHPNSEGTDISWSLRGTNSGFKFNTGIQVASTVSTSGNLQYNGETRVGMSSSGGYLGKGTSSSRRALAWDADGKVTQIQTSNGLGEVGQALTVGNNQTLEWATPASAQPKPGPFTWWWEKRTSGTASSGCMWWESSKFLYLSSTTAEGARLAVSSDFPTAATYFSSYFVGANSTNRAQNLKFWMLNSSGAWELKAWAVPYKHRFGYRGWVQIEYTSKHGTLSAVTGSLWCITLPEFF